MLRSAPALQRVLLPTRLVRNVADPLSTPKGGGFRGQQKGHVPEIGLQFAPPFTNFFFAEENFSDVGGWVDGWVGRMGGAPPHPRDAL